MASAIATVLDAHKLAGVVKVLWVVAAAVQVARGFSSQVRQRASGASGPSRRRDWLACCGEIEAQRGPDARLAFTVSPPDFSLVVSAWPYFFLGLHTRRS